MMTKMEGQKLILLLALVGLILGSPISARPMGWGNQEPDSFEVIGHSPYDSYEGYNYPSSAEPFSLPEQYEDTTQSIFQHPLETVDNMFNGKTDPFAYDDMDDWP